MTSQNETLSCRVEQSLSCESNTNSQSDKNSNIGKNPTQTSSMDSITTPLSQVASSLKKYNFFMTKSTPDIDDPSSLKDHESAAILHSQYEHSHATTNTHSISDGDLTIPQYYSGKCIFLTGATGFIGKVFIEKLLRCCPDLECIYCLVRPKKNQSIEERIVDLTSSKLFDRLRVERPDFARQVKAVSGDLLLPHLGLCEGDRRMLEERVHIVFHNAATVRFDEALRVAVEMNVLAVRKMIALCRNFKHLESYVHVSTAYANCDKPHIEETVYPPTVEPQKIIDVLEWMDDDMVQMFAPKLLGDKPNTYTFTKQLAEHLLVTEGRGLPIAIVRPSIVGATWKEPFSGWIDNFNGPSGLFIATGKGVLRSMKGDPSCAADIVPVDIPVNIMLATAWYTAVNKPTEVLVYHATTGGAVPCTWGDIGGIVNKAYKQVPLESCFRRPNVAFIANSYVHDYWTVVTHFLPAYVADLVCNMMGKKPRMVKMYNRLHRSINSLEYFTLNQWQWTNDNHDRLRKQMTPADQKMFYMDGRPIDWATYHDNYCIGAKKYILNEDLTGLPAARAHVRKLRLLRFVFNTSVIVVFWRVLIAKSQPARNLWFFIVGLVSKFVKYFRISSTMHTRP